MVKYRLAGMAGSSLLFLGSSMALDSHLQLLAGTEGHHPARGNRNFLAGLGIAPRPLVLVSQVEVAETRQLHLLPLLECLAQHLEECIDEFLRLALVEAHVHEQTLGHFRFGQRHVQDLSLAPNVFFSDATASATLRSASSSVSVREPSCKIKPIATLFSPSFKFGPV